MTFWEFINKYYDCFIVVETVSQRLSFSNAVKFVPFWMIREYGNCVVDFKELDKNLSTYEKTLEVTIHDKGSLL